MAVFVWSLWLVKRQVHAYHKNIGIHYFMSENPSPHLCHCELGSGIAEKEGVLRSRIWFTIFALKVLQQKPLPKKAAVQAWFLHTLGRRLSLKSAQRVG